MVAYKGMKKATKAELAHLARVKEMPCLVCAKGKQIDPTEVHHIVVGSRRLGHFFVLPLCTFHHVRVYLLSQRRLWQALNVKMGIEREWPASKIVPRRVA